jgi:hypothetical protein
MTKSRVLKAFIRNISLFERVEVRVCLPHISTLNVFVRFKRGSSESAKGVSFRLRCLTTGNKVLAQSMLYKVI